MFLKFHRGFQCWPFLISQGFQTLGGGRVGAKVGEKNETELRTKNTKQIFCMTTVKARLCFGCFVVGPTWLLWLAVWEQQRKATNFICLNSHTPQWTCKGAEPEITFCSSELSVLRNCSTKMLFLCWFIHFNRAGNVGTFCQLWVSLIKLYLSAQIIKASRFIRNYKKRHRRPFYLALFLEHWAQTHFCTTLCVNLQ